MAGGYIVFRPVVGATRHGGSTWRSKITQVMVGKQKRQTQ